MPIQRFGEWLPDLPALENPGLVTALNVHVEQNKYVPVKSLVVFSDALAARCVGAIAVRDTSNNVVVYAATATKLYVLDDESWLDRTRATGGDYATDSSRLWRFVQWQNDKVIGTNFDDEPQVITIGGSNFADLAGTPPQAKYIAVVRDFVALANTSTNFSEVRWSGKGNEETWAVSQATQAGSMVLESGGPISGITGGEFGVVLTETSVWLMQYVGPPQVFQFDETIPGVGCTLPNSVVRRGGLTYFYGTDGFRVTDGRTSKRIGIDRVDNTVRDFFQEGQPERVVAVADRLSERIHWGFPEKGSDGNITKLFTYHPSRDRWTQQEYSVTFLTVGAESAQTLDGLDAKYSSVDAIPISLDDPFWAGGNFQLGAFDTSHRLNFFVGDIKQATLETGEFQLSPGRKTFLRRVRPVVDDSSATLTYGYRDRPHETVTYTTAVAQNVNGVCPTRTNARYHRVRLVTNGDFSEVQGIELNPEDFSQGGRTR